MFQRNLTEYYNAIDSNNMMIVFASMLYERRIIFTSRRLYRLSACVQSANAVIYPMSWQHIFIPVLPHQLVDYLLAPMPYLIGVSNTLINVSDIDKPMEEYCLRERYQVYQKSVITNRS